MVMFKNSLVFLSQKLLCLRIQTDRQTTLLTLLTMFVFIGVNRYRLGCFLARVSRLETNQMNFFPLLTLASTCGGN